MKEVHGVRVGARPDEIYYILPIDGCETCVRLNITSLAQVSPNKSIFPVFIGQLPFNDLQLDLDSISNRFKTYQDDNMRILRYETGYGKPILFHYKEGQCIKHFTVYDDLVDEVRGYIETQTNPIP